MRFIKKWLKGLAKINSVTITIDLKKIREKINSDHKNLSPEKIYLP